MRLTKKSDKLGYCLRHSSIRTNKCWNKLGQLEDIEEELGIDLLTLFKALKNGVYYRNNQKQINFAKSERVYLSHKSLRVDYRTYKFFKDYGKTWALTEEELE